MNKEKGKNNIKDEDKGERKEENSLKKAREKMEPTTKKSKDAI